MPVRSVAVMKVMLTGTVLVVAGAVLMAIAKGAVPTTVVLPNDWLLQSPSDAVTETGTMPQGAALSPDGKLIAVVESGFNPPALSLYSTPDVRKVRSVALKGAFGRPAWMGTQVVVAGANADAVFVVDSQTGAVRTIALAAKSYPVSVAAMGDTVAVATDGDGALRVSRLDQLATAHPVPIGTHPGGLAFSSDGSRVFAAIRSASTVACVSVGDGSVTQIATGLHPADVLAQGAELYVAESDADAVSVFDAVSLRRFTTIPVGIEREGERLAGASPNALAAQGETVYVSLGAANQVVLIQDHTVAERVPTGWYPTDVVATADRLYIVDGKGEGTKPNPNFNFQSKSNDGYVAAIQTGSLRSLSVRDLPPLDEAGPVQLPPVPPNTIVRKGGPIRHVFFILKENRTYDQVLGDVAAGNGDAKLTNFGGRITPNQHAIAKRFGLFDNTYASGEVSDAGHNWADGAFANDYVERWWPPTYGDRRDIDDTVTGTGAGVPANGYLWDAARRANVSFRDYGEMGTRPPQAPGPTSPTLRGHMDLRYIGWDLNRSDIDRVKEWQREFDAFVRSGTLPQFEYLWLPNDHTYGSRAGKLTPSAYVAQNDYALGLIVQVISHSPVWKSSAIFAIEDDAQDGADHVSAQRTTLYLASPYARGGLEHAHYSTLSVLRTIETILGMRPLSVYDASAAPMYAAFTATAHLAPFTAIAPQIDITARNKAAALVPRAAAAADYSRPDAAFPSEVTMRRR